MIKFLAITVSILSSTVFLSAHNSTSKFYWNISLCDTNISYYPHIDLFNMMLSHPKYRIGIGVNLGKIIHMGDTVFVIHPDNTEEAVPYRIAVAYFPISLYYLFYIKESREKIFIDEKLISDKIKLQTASIFVSWSDNPSFSFSLPVKTFFAGINYNLSKWFSVEAGYYQISRDGFKYKLPYYDGYDSVLGTRNSGFYFALKIHLGWGWRASYW